MTFFPSEVVKIKSWLLAAIVIIIAVALILIVLKLNGNI
jgi:hypothetical protein